MATEDDSGNGDYSGALKTKKKPGRSKDSSGSGGFFHDLLSGYDTAVNAIGSIGEAYKDAQRQQGGSGVTEVAGEVGSSAEAAGKDFGKLGGATFPDKTAPAGGKKKHTTTTTTTTSTPPASAAENLLDGLAKQYQDEMALVNPYISGSNAPQFSAQAQAIGQSIAGNAVEGQSAASEQMLAKDSASYAAANQAGAQGIATALKDTGQADQEMLSVSPYMGLLNALTSEAQYKTETGTPTFSIAGTPTWLQQAYKSTIGQSAPGTTGVGSTTPNPTTSSTTPSTDQSSSPGAAGGSG